MIDHPKRKPAPPDWKAQAAAAAQAEADHWAAALLARAGIPPERATFTQQSDFQLLATVDGETFRLSKSPLPGLFGNHLMLLRPCTFCHQGLFPSGWADTPAALGRVLARHHPVCSACKRAGRGTK